MLNADNCRASCLAPGATAQVRAPYYGDLLFQQAVAGGVQPMAVRGGG